MVSAVILSYNRYAEVLITIEKLKYLSHSLPFELEIIVVDNACTDNTAKIIQSQYADVTLVTISKNKGIAGWNEGFKIAKYKYILVLDDDSHIETGLTEAVNYLEENQKVGILALNVTTGPYKTKDWGWHDKMELPTFFGCGAIISANLYKRIGGFAEWMHLYSHEWEYCLRANNIGYKTEYFEYSNVIHRTNSSHRSTKRLRVYCARNEMAIIYKYFGKRKWFYIFRVCLNHLKYLRIGAFRHVWYSFIGIKEFFKMKNTLIPTPVSIEAQKFFADHNYNTKPFFGNMIKRITKIFK